VLIVFLIRAIYGGFFLKKRDKCPKRNGILSAKKNCSPIKGVQLGKAGKIPAGKIVQEILGRNG